MSIRAEKEALRAYPKEKGKVHSTAFGIIEFDRNAEGRRGYQEGYEQAETDIISIIKSRINEILGDAQPKPALRVELQELIDKINGVTTTRITIEQAEQKLFDLLKMEDMGDRIYEFAQTLFQRYIKIIETENIIIDNNELDSWEEWYDAVQEEFYQAVYYRATEFLTNK